MAVDDDEAMVYALGKEEIADFLER